MLTDAIKLDSLYNYNLRSTMFENGFLGNFQGILPIAGCDINDGFSRSHGSFHQTLSVGIFSYQTDDFAIMVCKLFDELFVMRFFSTHCIGIEN